MTSYLNSEDKCENTESERELRQLESEICSLSQCDGDPALLWRLREKRDIHYLRLLSPVLAALRVKDEERLLALKEFQEGGLRALEVAFTRTDLTIPELLFLNKFSAQALEQERRSLLAQKKSIERRLTGKRDLY